MSNFRPIEGNTGGSLFIIRAIKCGWVYGINEMKNNEEFQCIA